MHRSFLEFSEAKGKVVEALRVYDDPPYGREVYMEFSDGTRLLIDIAIETSVCSKHYTEDQGDLRILVERRDRPIPKNMYLIEDLIRPRLTLTPRAVKMNRSGDWSSRRLQTDGGLQPHSPQGGHVLDRDKRVARAYAMIYGNAIPASFRSRWDVCSLIGGCGTEPFRLVFCWEPGFIEAIEGSET